MKILTHPATKKFLRDVRSQCRDYGVKFTIVNSSRVVDGNQDYSGYFVDSEERRELLVSNPSQGLMLSVLVHEFSHMRQWIECEPAYTKMMRGGIDPYGVLTDWLGGKDFAKSTVDDCIRKIMACELDCDRRALTTISEYGLPVDREDYVLDAMAYQYFLLYVKRKRSWMFDGKGFGCSDIKGVVVPNLDRTFVRIPARVGELLESRLIVG